MNKKKILEIIGVLFFSLVCVGSFLFFLKFIGLIDYRYNIIKEKTFNASDVGDIDILINAGHLYVKNSEDSSIKVTIYGENENDAVVKMIDDKLVINYPEYANSYYNMGNYSMDIILYLPRDFKNNVMVKSDEGDVSFESFPLANINIKSDFGGINVNEVNNLEIEADSAWIKINKVKNKLNISCDYCDTRIYDFDIKEDSSIINNYGYIVIDKVANAKISASSNRSVKVKGSDDTSSINLKLSSNDSYIKVNQ